MGKHITPFCYACDKCPELFDNLSNEQGRQVIIKDGCCIEGVEVVKEADEPILFYTI